MGMETARQSSWYLRLKWLLILYILQGVLKIVKFAGRWSGAPRLCRPTYTKRYPAHPRLVNHVWIPDSYKPGVLAVPPLLIDIHGGGFCFGHPFVDDADNAILCHSHGILVVSINYRKAPRYSFPAAVEDCAALIQVVLDDPDLPFDRNKVALIGYSAGGNLSLAAPQLRGLLNRIYGVVSVYPVTDLSRTLKQRVENSIAPPNREDILVRLSPMFRWAYLPPEGQLKNPLLSPLYAPRSMLPNKIFIIGCEYDVLLQEAKDLADKLAEEEDHASQQAKTALGNGRSGWTCGRVAWEEIKAVEHGFNARWKRESDNNLKQSWKTKTDKMHMGIAEWLYREVYQ